MRLIFKIQTLLLVLQSTVFAIGTQFLVIPHNNSELIAGYNPALLSFSTKPIISASYGNWLADMQISAIDYDQNLFNGWGGMTLRYISLDDIELRTERPTDEPISYYNASAIALEGRYSQQYNFGYFTTTIKYLSIQLYDETANGVAGDISWRKDICEDFGIGFSLLNMGVMTKLYDEKPQLPIRGIFGITYSSNLNQISNKIAFATEKSALVNGLIFRVNNSINLEKIKFLIGSQIANKNISVSSGINIILGNYQFGYAVQFGTSSLGIPQFLNFSVILP